MAGYTLNAAINPEGQAVKTGGTGTGTVSGGYVQGGSSSQTKPLPQPQSQAQEKITPIATHLPSVSGTQPIQEAVASSVPAAEAEALLADQLAVSSYTGLPLSTVQNNWQTGANLSKGAPGYYAQEQVAETKGGYVSDVGNISVSTSKGISPTQPITSRTTNFYTKTTPAESEAITEAYLLPKPGMSEAPKPGTISENVGLSITQFYQGGKEIKGATVQPITLYLEPVEIKTPAKTSSNVSLSNAPLEPAPLSPQGISKEVINLGAAIETYDPFAKAGQYLFNPAIRQYGGKTGLFSEGVVYLAEFGEGLTTIPQFIAKTIVAAGGVGATAGYEIGFERTFPSYTLSKLGESTLTAGETVANPSFIASTGLTLLATGGIAGVLAGEGGTASPAFEKTSFDLNTAISYKGLASFGKPLIGLTVEEGKISGVVLGTPSFAGETPTVFPTSGSAGEVNIADVASRAEYNIRKSAYQTYSQLTEQPQIAERLSMLERATAATYKTVIPFEKGISTMLEAEALEGLPEAAKTNLLDYFTKNKANIQSIYGSFSSELRGASARGFNDIDLQVNIEALKFGEGAVKAIQAGGGEAEMIGNVLNVGGIKALDIHDLVIDESTAKMVGSGLGIGFGYLAKAPEFYEGFPYMATGEQIARVGSSLSFLRGNEEGEYLGGSAANAKRVADFIALVQKSAQVSGLSDYQDFGAAFEKYLNPEEKAYLAENPEVAGKIGLYVSPEEEVASMRVQGFASPSFGSASPSGSPSLGSPSISGGSLGSASPGSPSISPSFSPSTSISVSPSPSPSPSVSTSVSPSLSLSPSFSPSTSPSPSSSPSISLSPSPSPSPGSPSSPPSAPPSLIPSFGSPSKKNQGWKKLAVKISPKKQKRGKKGGAPYALPDLFYAAKSQRLFGKATAPRASNPNVQRAIRNYGFRLKTVEELSGKLPPKPKKSKGLLINFTNKFSIKGKPFKIGGKRGGLGL